MRALVAGLLSLSVGAMPAGAQSWLTVGDADGSFRLDMLVPFDVPPTETEPDGTVRFSYVHETPEFVLRLEVIDAAGGRPVIGPLLVASRTMEGTRVLQTRMYQIGLRTYRLIVKSTPELENDPVIVRFLGSMRLAR